MYEPHTHPTSEECRVPKPMRTTGSSHHEDLKPWQPIAIGHEVVGDDPPAGKSGGLCIQMPSILTSTHRERRTKER